MTARARLNSPSLRVAAARLRALGQQGPGAPTWLDDTRQAVREAVTAVEAEIDAVTGADGFGQQIASEEPRLIHAIEDLEVRLAAALVELWRLKDADPEATKPRAALLARDLEDIAARGFAIAYESLVRPAAAD